MPPHASFSVTDLERASAAVATAALARPCPVLHFHPETAAQVGAGAASRTSAPRGPHVAVEPPRRAPDADELWQLARHRLVRRLAAWRMEQHAFDGPTPTQTQLNRAADALVAAEGRRRLPGDWVALSAHDLAELTGAGVAEPGATPPPLLWIPLAAMPKTWSWALAEARRRILAAHQAAGRGVSAFGFPSNDRGDLPAARAA